MRLFEHEAKTLLRQNNIESPLPLALGVLGELSFTKPCILKAQILTGNRWNKGLIQPCSTSTDWLNAGQNLLAALAKHHFPPDTPVLVEPLVEFGQEMYLAIRYDTVTRQAVLYFEPRGGTGIEERQQGQSLPAYPLADLAETPVPPLPADLHPDWLQSLIQTFFQNDLLLLEINPLVLVAGRPLVLDAKIELEDNAAFRHPEWVNYPPRTLFTRAPSAHEQQAKLVNAMDHRGVAGASYFDFDGTIGILASGGGASQLAMDALLAANLKPANYTEYSGNPTREKVRALAEIVLANPRLTALWVVGGHANFTDIYETLMGVMDALEQAKLPPGFPVVARRGGPRTEEAFTALRQRAAALNLRLKLFDSSYPITDTVAVLQQLLEEKN